MIEAARVRTFNRRKAGYTSRPRFLSAPPVLSGTAFLLAAGVPQAIARGYTTLPLGDDDADSESGVILTRQNADVADDNPGASVLLIETFDIGAAVT
ncbi:MAG TPA: hypothetical protein VFZ21_06600 [Gemmatimonadaceae bacterium]|nr:hypothetical protein [Gemmatimonadaceae bacterium]